MDTGIPTGGYATDAYDPALVERVERAAYHACRSAESRASLRALAPLDRCSVEMRTFYWRVFLRVWQEEAKRVPGDQEVPAVPGQEDDDL